MEQFVLVILMFVNNPASAGNVAHIEFNSLEQCTQVGQDLSSALTNTKVYNGAKQSTISWGCFKK